VRLASGAKDWRLVGEGLAVKRYPVCYAAHRAIDAVIELRARERLRAADVARVTVTLGRAPAATLRFDNPQTAGEARFSLHHNVAAALTDGCVGFSQLADDYVRRADIAACYSLTELRVSDDECPEQPGMARFDRVTIETREGRLLDSGPIRYAKGHARLPLSDEELDVKFLDCARRGGRTDGVELLDRLHRLDRLENLAELTA
jgi:2-methylcitrate dehydratase PrpD